MSAKATQRRTGSSIAGKRGGVPTIASDTAATVVPVPVPEHTKEQGYESGGDRSKAAVELVSMFGSMLAYTAVFTVAIFLAASLLDRLIPGSIGSAVRCVKEVEDFFFKAFLWVVSSAERSVAKLMIEPAPQYLIRVWRFVGAELGHPWAPLWIGAFALAVLCACLTTAYSLYHGLGREETIRLMVCKLRSWA